MSLIWSGRNVMDGGSFSRDIWAAYKTGLLIAGAVGAVLAAGVIYLLNHAQVAISWR